MPALQWLIGKVALPGSVRPPMLVSSAIRKLARYKITAPWSSSVEETGAPGVLGALPGTQQPDNRGAANPELLGDCPLTDPVLAKLFHFRHEFTWCHWSPMRFPVFSRLIDSCFHPIPQNIPFELLIMRSTALCRAFLARRRGATHVGRCRKADRRDGELKMDWTKPTGLAG